MDMAVNEDCLHYLPDGPPGSPGKAPACRVDANETDPFACPPGCLFYDYGTNPAPWKTEVLTRDRPAAGGWGPEGANH